MFKLLKAPDVPDYLLHQGKELLDERLNGAGDILARMVYAYSFIDKVNQEFVSQFTNCSKGCSACCRMDVQLTKFEAYFIEYSTGFSFAIGSPFSRHNTTPCPFLSPSNDCLIYDFRPLVCRTYHTLSDPALCGVMGENIIQYGVEAGNMGNPIFNMILKWIRLQNEIEFNGERRDIRDYFKLS
jgi:hypothetical protein